LPIRSIFGVAALMPLGNPVIVLIQVIIMWLILQGIGAADQSLEYGQWIILLLVDRLAPAQGNTNPPAQPCPRWGRHPRWRKFFQDLVCSRRCSLFSGITGQEAKKPLFRHK